jgi:phenylalanyl-tRNA synthetase beta chain
VPLAYPLSEKFAVLRPSLLPGLVDAVGHNRRHERRDVRLFEIGARFSAEGGEHESVALAWTGSAAPGHWSGSGRPVDFFDIKGVVARLAGALGLHLQFQPARSLYLVEGRAASIAARDVPVGVMGLLRPGLAEARGLPPTDEVFVAELDLETLANLAPAGEIHVSPLPRFPSVVRDLSVVVDEALPADTVRGTIVAAAPGELASVEEFDRYRGAGIPEGRVSLSFHLTFRAADRTLTDLEVDRGMDAIVAALAARHRAVRR